MRNSGRRAAGRPRHSRSHRSDSAKSSAKGHSDRTERQATHPAAVSAAQQAFLGDLYKALAESRTLAEDAPDVFRQIQQQLARDRAEGEGTKPPIADAEEKNALARELVKSVGPTLWDEAHTPHDNDNSDADRWHEEARTQAERADAIARQARQLLALFPPFDLVVHKAIDLGYLCRDTTERNLAWGSIGEILENVTGWAAAIDVRRPLALLAHQADMWETAARKDAKRRPGRRVDWRRRVLSEWVVLQLAQVGVLPIGGKTRTVGRVLSVVQRTAGFPERDIERDLRDVLKKPFVVEYLDKLRRGLTT